MEVVTKIQVLDGMKIKLIFSGGKKTVDVASSGLPERFPKLNNDLYFKQVKISGSSLAWPDGLQLDLEELLEDWEDASLQHEKIKSTGSFLDKVNRLK